jgi:CheY-like chemotaxis protein
MKEGIMPLVEVVTTETLSDGIGAQLAEESSNTVMTVEVGGPTESWPDRSKTGRILCVDDDIVSTSIRAEILREHGYSVVLYDRPLAALRSDLSMFDLAILDFDMPELNGRELLLRMRALGARFPVVLLTGCVEMLSSEDRVLFARCIDKGMPVYRLLDTIAEFLDPNQIPDCGLREQYRGTSSNRPRDPLR